MRWMRKDHLAAPALQMWWQHPLALRLALARQRRGQLCCNVNWRRFGRIGGTAICGMRSAGYAGRRFPFRCSAACSARTGTFL